MMTRASEVWPAKRLRYVTCRRRGGNLCRQPQASEVSFLPMDAIGEQGHLDLSATKPLDEVQSGYTRFSDGDVVIAKITPCFENGKGAFIEGTLDGVGFGTTELHVLTPSAEIDGRYLYYVTVDQRFRQLGTARMTGAAGQRRVPEDFVRDYEIRLPPLKQQHAIADYLDRQTALLDALIAAKMRILGLLFEKPKAVVARAVTCGLDAAAAIRDAGISWLGEMPAQWRAERTKWLFKERDERSDTGEEELLTVSHLTGVTPRSEKVVNMFQAATNEGYKICRSGDLIVNTMWAWMGAMGVARQDGIVSPAYNVYEPGACLDPRYVDALVRIPAFAQEARRHSTGVWSSRLRLYPEGFFEIVIPVPPLDVQREIVDYIANATSKLGELRTATQRTMVLLKERRAALITQAVTGEIELERTR